MRRSAPSTIFSSASVKSAAVTVLVVAPRGREGRLVDEVLEVGADHPGGRLGELLDVTSSASGTPRRCTLRISARPSRSGGLTTTRRSKRPGRSSAGSRISARLVAAITITPSQPLKPSISVRIWLSVCSRSSLPPSDGRAAAGAADRVELVDEDDRRRRGLRLGEEVAHPAGADAHDHLDELRRREREERHVGLAGDGAGQQRLARPGRPREQHAARDLAAEAAVAVRVAEEVDDLDELVLGLVDAGHVLERDPLRATRRSAWPWSARAPRAPRRRRRPRPAHQEHEQQHQQDHRAERQQQRRQQRPPLVDRLRRSPPRSGRSGAAAARRRRTPAAGCRSACSCGPSRPGR